MKSTTYMKSTPPKIPTPSSSTTKTVIVSITYEVEAQDVPIFVRQFRECLQSIDATVQPAHMEATVTIDDANAPAGVRELLKVVESKFRSKPVHGKGR